MDENKEIKNTDNKNLEVGEKKMFFFDEDGKSCSQEHAVKFVATVHDKDGKIIRETWGTCSPKRNKDESQDTFIRQ